MKTYWVARETSNPGNVLAVRDTREAALDTADSIEKEYDYDMRVDAFELDAIPSKWREFYLPE